MNCKKCQELIDQYIDNELEEGDKSHFLEHLENCPECKREYELTLSTVNLVRNYEELPIPAGLEIRMNNLIMAESAKMAKEKIALEEKLEEKPQKRGFWQNLWAKSYTPAFVVAIFLFAFSLNSYDLINTPNNDELIVITNNNIEENLEENLEGNPPANSSNALINMLPAENELPAANQENLKPNNFSEIPAERPVLTDEDGAIIPRNQTHSTASRSGGMRPSEFFQVAQDEIVKTETTGALENGATLITAENIVVDEINEISSQFILNIILGIALIGSIIYLILRKTAKIS